MLKNFRLHFNHLKNVSSPLKFNVAQKRKGVLSNQYRQHF